MTLKLIKWRDTYTADMVVPILSYNAALRELASANKMSRSAQGFALGRLNKARAEVKRLLAAKSGKQPAPRYEPLAPCRIGGVPCFVAADGGRMGFEPDLYAVNAKGYVMKFLMNHTCAESALYDAYMAHMRDERQHAVESAAIAGDMTYAARLARQTETYGEYH